MKKMGNFFHINENKLNKEKETSQQKKSPI